MMQKKGSLTLCLVLLVLPAPRAPATHGHPERRVAIPVGGNSWVVNTPEGSTAVIAGPGLTHWTDSGTVIRTFFGAEKAGEISIALRARAPDGRSRVSVTLGDRTAEIVLSGGAFDTIPAGVFTVRKPGYQRIDIRGVERAGATYGDVSYILIGVAAAAGKVWFVRDEFYWGRRGPSVHLNYDVPGGAGEIRWFYNEITVPAGEDALGSFFMANGFAEGYFGIQVNSPTERRILFSVWSPFQTDDPAKVPDDQNVRLLKKGEGVHAGEFGDEGSGGQSYLRYDWRAGVTYRCLLTAEPAAGGASDFTAYFYAPERGTWELIATFRRPKSGGGLRRLHSFLENFIPETGNIARKVFFSNGWVRSAAGTWYELTAAKLSVDATAKKEARLDFQGGVEGKNFFLKNCGFFDGTSLPGTAFMRGGAGKEPEVAGLP
jgi:hypothetical protein